MDVQSLAEQTAKDAPVTPAASATTPAPAPSAPAADPNAASPSTTTVAATKPEYVGDEFWDSAKNELKADDFGKHLKTLSEFKAAADARAADVPADAKDYVFEIPADLKLPEGVKPESIKVDEKNPLMVAFRTIAKEEGLTKAAANKLYGEFVKGEVAKATAINTRVAEERTAIGADAPARVDAIGQFLTAHLGEQSSKAMMSGVFTAAQVKGFEALMQKFAGGNIVPFTPKGGAPSAEPGKIEGYETMTYEQRRFAQDQAAAAKVK